MTYVLFCTISDTIPVQMIKATTPFSWFLVTYFKQDSLFIFSYIETKLVFFFCYLANTLQFSSMKQPSAFVLGKLFSRSPRLWRSLHQGHWQLSQLKGLSTLFVYFLGSHSVSDSVICFGPQHSTKCGQVQ